MYPVAGRVFMVLEKAVTDLDKLIRQRYRSPCHPRVFRLNYVVITQNGIPL